MSKKCKSCDILNENPLMKLCRKCHYENFVPKITKIRSISKKKQIRLKEIGSEKSLFEKVWNSRSHECEECKKYLHTPKIHNFDHIIPKSQGEKFRYDEKNIKILCFACHFQKTTGLNYKWIDLDL